MKEVTLSSGITMQINPLKLSQARRMSELFDAGKPMDATVGACVDALNNAGVPTLTPAAFEDQYTIPEANELFEQVLDVSNLKMGEAKANP